MASGLGFLALGADGGGSIRIPSNFCGVYGIKPNYGRVPLYPSVGILSEIQVDQYGPIVRYVEDARIKIRQQRFVVERQPVRTRDAKGLVLTANAIYPP